MSADAYVRFVPRGTLAPAPAPTLHERRAAYWQTRERGREAEAVTLWSAYLLWQLVPGNLTLPPSAFLAYMCEGREESPGTLYNTLDRGRALSLGYSGSLTRLAQIGRALRTGIPRAEVDALSPAELAARLRVQRLSDSESAARALAPLRERTRDLLREADPTAPTAPTEADALNLEALELLAERVPGVYRAAVQATQTGDVDLLTDLAAATRPLTGSLASTEIVRGISLRRIAGDRDGGLALIAHGGAGEPNSTYITREEALKLAEALTRAARSER